MMETLNGTDLLVFVVSVIMSVVIGFTIAFRTNDTAFMSDEDIDKLFGSNAEDDPDDEDDCDDEDFSEETEKIIAVSRSLDEKEDDQSEIV